jgi:CHAT domain-containing protein
VAGESQEAPAIVVNPLFDAKSTAATQTNGRRAIGLLGTGVYGLRRALVLAGSETQVMSLWQVSDAATRDLMIAYYTRLQAGAGRIAAMRQVQLAMLRGAVLAKSGEIQRSIGLAPPAAQTQARSGDLGAADITPKAEWRHPYYWAAFIPSGAWTPLDGKEPK